MYIGDTGAASGPPLLPHTHGRSIWASPPPSPLSPSRARARSFQGLVCEGERLASGGRCGCSCGMALTPTTRCRRRTAARWCNVRVAVARKLPATSRCFLRMYLPGCAAVQRWRRQACLSGAEIWAQSPGPVLPSSQCTRRLENSWILGVVAQGLHERERCCITSLGVLLPSTSASLTPRIIVLRLACAY